MEVVQPREQVGRQSKYENPLGNATAATVDALHALCSERKGEAKVLFDLDRDGDFMVVMEAEGYNVMPDRNFLGRVEELCGRDSVRKIS